MHLGFELGRSFFAWDSMEQSYHEWVLEDRIWREDGVSVILCCVAYDRRVVVNNEQWRAVVCDRSNGDWIAGMYDGQDANRQPQYVPHQRQKANAEPQYTEFPMKVLPTTPSDLSFEKIEGRGSRTEVNYFLEGDRDTLVDHQLGGVSKWKAAFVARYEGTIVSAIVLHHYNPSTNGVELAITRLANHAVAPKNTSTWMIARARNWAERAGGYERLATYADLDRNDGTVYDAAGMEQVGEPELVQGKNWKGDEDEDQEEWHRQKWVNELAPEKYEDKSEEWGVETVVDRRWTPGPNAPITPSLSHDLYGVRTGQSRLEMFTQERAKPQATT